MLQLTEFSLLRITVIALFKLVRTGRPTGIRPHSEVFSIIWYYKRISCHLCFAREAPPPPSARPPPHPTLSIRRTWLKISTACIAMWILLSIKIIFLFSHFIDTVSLCIFLLKIVTLTYSHWFIELSTDARAVEIYPRAVSTMTTGSLMIMRKASY